jgi:hypothetical protein
LLAEHADLLVAWTHLQEQLDKTGNRSHGRSAAIAAPLKIMPPFAKPGKNTSHLPFGRRGSIQMAK